MKIGKESEKINIKEEKLLLKELKNPTQKQKNKK